MISSFKFINLENAITGSPVTSIKLPTLKQQNRITDLLLLLTEFHGFSRAHCSKIAKSIVEPQKLIKKLESVKKNEDGSWDFGDIELEKIGEVFFLTYTGRVFTQEVTADLLNFRTAPENEYEGDIFDTKTFKTPSRFSLKNEAILKFDRTIQYTQLRKQLRNNFKSVSRENPLKMIEREGVRVPIVLALQEIRIDKNGDKYTLISLMTTDGGSRVTACQSAQSIEPVSTLDEDTFLKVQKKYRNEKNYLTSIWSKDKNKLDQLVDDYYSSSSSESYKKSIKNDLEELIKNINFHELFWNTFTIPAKIIIGCYKSPDVSSLFHEAINEDVYSRHVDPKPWSDYAINISTSVSVMDALRLNRPILNIIAPEDVNIYWDVMAAKVPISNLKNIGISAEPHIRTLCLTWHMLHKPSQRLMNAMRNNKSSSKQCSIITATLISRGYASFELISSENIEYFGKYFITKEVRKRCKNGWSPSGKSLEELKKDALKQCKNDGTLEVEQIADSQFEIALAGSAALLMLGLIQTSTGKQKEIFKLSYQPSPTDWCFEAVKCDWGIHQLVNVLDLISQGRKSYYILDHNNLPNTSKDNVNNGNLRLRLKNIFPKRFDLAHYESEDRDEDTPIDEDDDFGDLFSETRSPQETTDERITKTLDSAIKLSKYLKDLLSLLEGYDDELYVTDNTDAFLRERRTFDVISNDYFKISEIIRSLPDAPYQEELLDE